MEIYIPSYNRPDIISTHKLLGDLPYKIVVDDEIQKGYYLMNKTILPENIIVMGGKKHGIVSVRSFVGSLAKNGEWYVMLDDIATRITWNPSREDFLDTKNNKRLKKDFENNCSPKDLLSVFEEMIKFAEGENIYLCGFSTTPNFFFRGKHYSFVSNVKGVAEIIRKTDIDWDENCYTMEEYDFTAKHLKAHGKVLVNNFVHFHKVHYQKGGIGTYEERLPLKIKHSKYIMEKYPGLFYQPNKKTAYKEGELMIKLHTLKGIENWRKELSPSTI